jgi:hypothetical protein
MDIEYKEVRGRIQISYRLESHEFKRFPHALDVEGEADWLHRRVLGFVPRVIRRRGESAIIAWAQEKCACDMERLYKDVMSRYEIQEARMRSFHRPLAVTHVSGVGLSGHVEYGDRFGGRIFMDEPFILRNDERLYVPNRFAFGIPMFEWTGEMSVRGMALAVKQLIELYEKEMRRRKHGSAIDLAERLNKKSGKKF